MSRVSVKAFLEEQRTAAVVALQDSPKGVDALQSRIALIDWLLSRQRELSVDEFRESVADVINGNHAVPGLTSTVHATALLQDWLSNRTR